MQKSKAAPLLYCGIVPYHSIRQRPQWLADLLSHNRRVLYVEPHVSHLNASAASDKVQKIHEQLAVYTPPAALPITGYIPLFNRISYARTAANIGKILRRLAWPAPSQLWTSFPKQIDMVRRFDGVPVVYDVMDDYPAFFGMGQRTVLRKMHKALIQRADLIFASSNVLAQKVHAQTGKRAAVIENGVGRDFIEKCQQALVADDIKDLPKPIFGYVGAISAWFDFAAVSEIANSFPQGSVVLVGPVDTQLPSLPSNVHLLGRRPHDQLPSLLKGFDVGLVPFEVTPAIDAVNPVKVYEYMAAGLRILGSDFAELRRFGDAVTCCTKENWASAALLILDGHHNERMQIQRALDGTWEARALRVEELLLTMRENKLDG